MVNSNWVEGEVEREGERERKKVPSPLEVRNTDCGFMAQRSENSFVYSGQLHINPRSCV